MDTSSGAVAPIPRAIAFPSILIFETLASLSISVGFSPTLVVGHCALLVNAE